MSPNLSPHELFIDKEIRATENYAVLVRGDFQIRAKWPFKGGLKKLEETMTNRRGVRQFKPI